MTITRNFVQRMRQIMEVVNFEDHLFFSTTDQLLLSLRWIQCIEGFKEAKEPKDRRIYGIDVISRQRDSNHQ